MPSCVQTSLGGSHVKGNKHYANTPMRYTAIFHGSKNINFQIKNCNFFLIFARNNEAVLTSTHNLCFGENKKIMYTPEHPSFTI